MKLMTPFALVMLSTCTPALAGTFTSEQTFTYSFDQDDKFPMATFASFDTQGGTRQLTNVFLRAQVDLTLGVVIRNFDAMPYKSGTWFADASHSLLVPFFPPEGDPERGAPFYGLGGIELVDITGDLSAGSGDPEGPPGNITVSASGKATIDSIIDTDPGYFSFFSSGLPLTAAIAPFTDGTILPPDGGVGFGISIDFAEFSQSGSLSLIYEYQLVPAPGAAVMLLGGTAFVTVRRRR